MASRFFVLASASCFLFQKDGISLQLKRSLSLLPASRILGGSQASSHSVLSLLVSKLVMFLHIHLFYELCESPVNVLGVHIIRQKPHAQILSKCGFVTEIRLHVNYRNLLNSFCKALFVFDSGV